MNGYDVAVVGGRVAGSSTAMLLARAGLRVALLDRSSYGSDTVSTHALMRTGVLQLSRWGLLDELKAAGTPPVHRVTFQYVDADPV
jgi:2-polyprenyl-6-methoxyphenol hydroxylase-like FAD-dependent oxidoreductase